MSELLSFHSTKILPPHLTEFVFSLVNLRESFDIKAEKCAFKALRDFEMGKAYAVRIKHTSVFDKAKNCCSIFSYEKVRLFVCLFVVCLVTSPNYRSTKLRASRSKSSHFSPGAEGHQAKDQQGLLRVHPQQDGLPLIWFFQYLIIFSNKWPYLNIFRTLQIHTHTIYCQ